MRASRLLACVLISSILLSPLPSFAEPSDYEKVLKVISGDQSDLTILYYDGHVVSHGFALSISMMAPIKPNDWRFSKVASAVSLGDSWGQGIYHYEPRVTSMWMKIEGDSNFRIDTLGIVDNTGSGSSCTISWRDLIDVLLTILPFVFEYLAQEPPLTEWQCDLHWAEAIVRSRDPYGGGHIQPPYYPGIETAACDFNSLFLLNGYQHLTVTGGADIGLVRSWIAQGDYFVWEVIPIGTYSATFEVEAPVTNAPETPSLPFGRQEGYASTSYEYSTSTIDPNGDDIRYQFDWGDTAKTTTDWHASGVIACASHNWSSFGTFNVMVRAQDVYEEWSNWSPYCVVVIYGMGDVAHDGLVNIFDLVTVAVWYGITCPPAPIDADATPDNYIDIFDVVKVASHFGEIYSYYQGLTGLPESPMTQLLTGLSTFISVDPSQITVYKHQTLSVNVTVTNVTRLYGWEFKAYWNNTILNLTSVQVHTPEVWGQDTSSAGTGIQNDFNETYGRYWKAMSALNPSPPFNGSMTLVTLTFEALDTGITSFDLQDTKLSDSEALVIDHDDFDGAVTVATSPLYMRSDQHTINNATMYKLMETHTQNGTSTSMLTGDPENDVACYWGIRVWKRSANGTEVELTSGSPVAVVSRSSSGQGLQSATWTCPATSLNPTDSLVVRVYYKFDFQSSYTLSGQFTTVQLNATSLAGETWTIYYYTRRSYNTQTHRTTIYYYWDNTYGSRIENLKYG